MKYRNYIQDGKIRYRDYGVKPSQLGAILVCICGLKPEEGEL